jgi:hypothetical protein
MALTSEEACELIESVFTFDYVGDSMFAVRKDPKSETKKQELVKQLIDEAVKKVSNSDVQNLEIITKAANERVEQYSQGSQASQTGCGGI